MAITADFIKKSYVYQEAHRLGIQAGKSEGMKKGIKEGREKGVIEGRKEEKGALARKLFRMQGLSTEQIAELTELPLAHIIALREEGAK